MEIPTEEIIEQLEILLPHHRQDAIQLIKAQALEMRELQAVVVKLRDELLSKNGDLIFEKWKNEKNS